MPEQPFDVTDDDGNRYKLTPIVVPDTETGHAPTQTLWKLWGPYRDGLLAPPPTVPDLGADIVTEPLSASNVQHMPDPYKPAPGRPAGGPDA